MYVFRHVVKTSSFSFISNILQVILYIFIELLCYLYGFMLYRLLVSYLSVEEARAWRKKHHALAFIGRLKDVKD